MNEFLDEGEFIRCGSLPTGCTLDAVWLPSKSVDEVTGGSTHPKQYMIMLLRTQVEEMYAHARACDPMECCGLIGGAGNERAESVYRLRNAAFDPLVAYEAAPVDLFAAQRTMRERGERLLGIYHSHPRESEPEPSVTDVRLAYYPSAIYFIIGLKGMEPTLRAFRISEREAKWERVDYYIAFE